MSNCLQKWLFQSEFYIITYTQNTFADCCMNSECTYVCTVLTIPSALRQAACCTGPSESFSVSSALLLLSPLPLLLWTASGAGGPKLHPESSQHHVVS